MGIIMDINQRTQHRKKEKDTTKETPMIRTCFEINQLL